MYSPSPTENNSGDPGSSANANSGHSGYPGEQSQTGGIRAAVPEEPVAGPSVTSMPVTPAPVPNDEGSQTLVSTTIREINLLIPHLQATNRFLLEGFTPSLGVNTEVVEYCNTVRDLGKNLREIMLSYENETRVPTPKVFPKPSRFPIFLPVYSGVSPASASNNLEMICQRFRPMHTPPDYSPFILDASSISGVDVYDENENTVNIDDFGVSDFSDDDDED